MVALFAVLLALFCGLACAEPVEPEPLPTVLQQPAYAEPVVELEPVPFQEEMEIGCGDECVDCGPLVVQESFWYAGTDVLFTSLNFQTSAFYHDDTGGVGIRPYLGWENPSGVGGRIRYWHLDVEEDVSTLSDPEIESIFEVTAQSLDVDFYRRFHYDRSSFLLGVGTKAASIKFDNGLLGENRLSGGGIGGFVEGRHPLYVGPQLECSFVGYGRFSLLTGRARIRDWPDDRDEADTNMGITEIGLGLELKRRFRRGDVVLQILTETQRWETNLMGDVAFDSLGLRFGGQW